MEMTKNKSVNERKLKSMQLNNTPTKTAAVKARWVSVLKFKAIMK